MLDGLATPAHSKWVRIKALLHGIGQKPTLQSDRRMSAPPPTSDIAGFMSTRPGQGHGRKIIFRVQIQLRLKSIALMDTLTRLAQCRLSGLSWLVASDAG
jgi:hypothetical protein